SFQRGIQPIGEPPVRERRGPNEAQRRERNERGEARGNARDTPDISGGRKRYQRTERHERDAPRERGLMLEEPHAEREAERGESHDLRTRIFIRRVTGECLAR